MVQQHYFHWKSINLIMDNSPILTHVSKCRWWPIFLLLLFKSMNTHTHTLMLCLGVNMTFMITLHQFSLFYEKGHLEIRKIPLFPSFWIEISEQLIIVMMMMMDCHDRGKVWHPHFLLFSPFSYNYQITGNLVGMNCNYLYNSCHCPIKESTV